MSQLAGVPAAALPGSMKAKTRLVPGSSSRPSAAVGVGKWFADRPKGIETTCLPLAGLRPCTAFVVSYRPDQPVSDDRRASSAVVVGPQLFQVRALAETLTVCFVCWRSASEWSRRGVRHSDG